MTYKILINAGYKEFDVPKDEQYANRFFQKKIKDNNGVKYYIDDYELYENKKTKEEDIDEIDLYAKRQLEILEELQRCVKADCDFYLEHDECYEFLDYILNLQDEIKEANDNAIWWHNRYNAIKRQIETK